MLQGEVFVFEFGSVDGFTASAVVVGEVTGLTHEVWNDTMENGSLVSETFFARAQSAEVFACLWYYIRTELNDETASWLVIDGHVKKYTR